VKFTLSWLKTHLDTSASAEQIAARLTETGLEVESVENRADALAPFIVGHVVSAVPHPDADRLRVCIVDTGREKLQVVCGAPNARAGMKGVFAPVGSHIPGTGMDLKSGVIRGQASEGMLCSEREMGLSDAHEGIIELPEDAPAGASFATVAGLDDPLFDVAITPNRGDCLGVRGIARDLAAAGLGTLKPLDAAAIPAGFASPLRWTRDEDARTACPHVSGRYFRNLRNGPSPAWLQDRLRSIGLRPISALVDITNFMTHDLGRPLHVFDADRLTGDVLRMSLSRQGETLRALDGRDYTLEAGLTVIRDDAGVQGLAGVIGGAETGCQDDTRNVFLEAALFDPARVARAGRALNIHSDARFRFERGIDPASVQWGIEAASRLILELCGGEASDIVSDGPLPDAPRRAGLRLDYLRKRAGIAPEIEVVEGILQRLGFQTRRDGAGRIDTVIPGWRGDVEGEHCLVEEVLRIHGLDAVEALPLPRPGALPGQAISRAQRRVALAKRALAARGMMEAVTFSFTSARLAALFTPQGAGVPEGLRLANPISSDLDAMRPSILGNLATAAARNADRGEPDSALFEVGPTFGAEGGVEQRMTACGLRHGRNGPRHWAAAPRNADAFDAKADALAALEACGLPAGRVQTENGGPDWYHPGRAGTLRLGPVVLGRFGELHPAICKTLGLRGRASGFEIFLDAIPEPRRDTPARGALKTSAFMPVTRDFAFVAGDGVTADDVLRAALGADKKLVAGGAVFDLYQGPELKGGKSIAISITLQPRDTTLTEAEIAAVSDKIVANVARRTGAALREQG